jgi:ribulose-5-phosphate 4-epimerase/fuculose-1-phosphate aldolase
MEEEQTIRSLVCELCRQFYTLGWVTGTGGSISIRSGEKIFMTPSGVQKERIKPEELFIVNKAGEILSEPQSKLGCGKAKLSDCAPLFLHAYNQRDAGRYMLNFYCLCLPNTFRCCSS